MKRVALTTLLVPALLAGFVPAATAAPPDRAGYIVVLDDRVASPAVAAGEIAAQVGGRVGFVYEHALKGFSITVPPQAAAALGRNPNVRYVAADDVRHAVAQAV